VFVVCECLPRVCLVCVLYLWCVCLVCVRGRMRWVCVFCVGGECMLCVIVVFLCGVFGVCIDVCVCVCCVL